MGPDPTGEDCADLSTGPCVTIRVTPPPPPPRADNGIAVLTTLSVVGVTTSEVGVGDLILLGVGVAAGLEAIHNMASKATGDPPVPGATPGDETKGRTQQWEKPVARPKQIRISTT